MTTLQKLTKMITDRAVSDRQATEIMEIAKSEIAKDANYRMTWDRPASEYPKAFYNVVFALYVKPAAIKWVDENLPNAFWRMMFL